jgi:hypothetical protein
MRQMDGGAIDPLGLDRVQSMLSRRRAALPM